MIDHPPTDAHKLAVTTDLLRKAEAEVARLREAERIRTLQRDDAKDALTTERGAHEQTRAELQVMALQLGRAEMRVAELEQYTSQLMGRIETGNAARYAAESALASARSLLVDWESYDPDDQDCEWYDRRTAWLSAHPTPGAEKGAGT